MFEPIPELDPDLEWMLLSGQASQPMLLDALLEEYGAAVLSLSQALLGEASLARQAAEDTFTAALLNVHRYRSSDGVRVWLFRLALYRCRKATRRARMRRLFALLAPRRGGHAPAVAAQAENPAEAALGQALDELGSKARAAMLLHYAFGWEAAEIAAVLHDSQAETAARLERARGKLRAAADESPEQGFDASLVERLRRRWVEAQPESLDEDEILARARQRSARQKRAASVQEISWVGGALLLVAGAIWAFNLLVPEPGELAASPATRIAQASPAATSRPQPSPTATPNRRRTSESVVYFVQPGDTLESIATALGLAEDLLRAFNNLGPGQEVEPGQELVVPLDVPSGPRPSPTPVTPAPQPEPLTLASTSQEIYDRLVQNGSFWHTLWVDVQFLEYGPPGYIGPSKNYRIQNWFSPPRQMLGLSGFLEGEPRAAYLMNGLRGYMISLVPESEGRYNPTTAFAGLELRNRLFFNRSSLLSFSGSFDVVALEEVAGREALVVEWNLANGRREELWVDAVTGVILRHLEYAPDGGEGEAAEAEDILLSEFIVTGIAYDVDFPASLFDPQTPWSGEFATGVEGQQSQKRPRALADQQPSGPSVAPTPTVAAPPPASRQSLPYTTPPADFDPSGERLTFQYAHSFNSAYLRASLRSSLADLFAGPYYLGSVETGSPWDLTCDRSADGRRIAFANTGPATNPANLYWLDLGQVSEVRSTDYEQGEVTQFAFSPDGEQIALFWQPHRQNPVRRAIRTGVFGALVLLDTQTGETRQLLELIDAKSLVWSPDGRLLALIGRMNGRDQMDEHVMVVNVADGQVTYSRSIDYNSGNTTDWPVLDWGVDFPIDETPGLENCTG